MPRKKERSVELDILVEIGNSLKSGNDFFVGTMIISKLL